MHLNVVLPDMTHVTLEVDEQVKATELMDIVIEELDLDVQEARHVLSLWLASEHLGM